MLARDENDPDGELVLRQVEELFERTAYRLTVLTLHDAMGREQTIKTTAEHPVYKVGEGWVASGELKAGDTIGQADGRTSVVARVGREEHRDGIRVYNLRVAECHTYFVRAEGSDAEPVWVHNAYSRAEARRTKQDLILEDAANLDHSFGRHAEEFFSQHGGEATRANWLRVLQEAFGSNRMFDWDVRGQPTIALFAKIEGRTPFVLQFYKSGAEANQLASAFIPRGAQLYGMLRKMKG